MHTLHTARLILRAWQPQDQDLFAALNADAEVMAHFPAPLTREESDTLTQRIMDHMSRHGWGLWALERQSDGSFMGFTGLHPCPATLPFVREQPPLEAGWRLARQFWGQGYATEAARACLDFAFDELKEREVVAFTARSNARSQAVMQRLGMTQGRDFEHPALPPGHALRPHVLFTITAEQHRALSATPPHLS